MALTTPAVAAPATLRIVCAWCRRLIVDGPPTPVSHGICTACKAALFEQMNEGGQDR